MEYMSKYVYTGKVEITLKGYGVVTSGQVIETDLYINNPNFREYIEQENLGIKEKKSKHIKKRSK